MPYVLPFALTMITRAFTLPPCIRGFSDQSTSSYDDHVSDLGIPTIDLLFLTYSTLKRAMLHVSMGSKTNHNVSTNRKTEDDVCISSVKTHSFDRSYDIFALYPDVRKGRRKRTASRHDHSSLSEPNSCITNKYTSYNNDLSRGTQDILIESHPVWS